MKRNFSFLLTIFIALAAFVSVSLAEHFSQNNRSLSLRELLTNANTYHGQVVTLQGELIGDLIRAPEGFWVNLLEGPNCLGLWFPREMMPRIGQLGRYQVRGDIVEVQGTFFQHCPLHGTGPDLHVISMKVVLPGYEEKEYFFREELIAIVLFGTIGLCSVLLMRMLKKKRQGSTRRQNSFPGGDSA